MLWRNFPLFCSRIVLEGKATKNIVVCLKGTLSLRSLEENKQTNPKNAGASEENRVESSNVYKSYSCIKEYFDFIWS